MALGWSYTESMRSKRRIARWANRRGSGTHKPIYPIQARVVSGRYRVLVQWVECKRYRMAVVHVAGQPNRQNERVRIPIYGRVLAEAVGSKQQFLAKTESITDFVRARLPAPELRRR